MAELCKECFIEVWQPDERDISQIILSDDKDVCERCLGFGRYVDRVDNSSQEKSDSRAR